MKLIQLIVKNKREFTAICCLSILPLLTANAHDSHTHEAPWQACADKQNTQQCEFKNGDGDLHKGSCQLFSETLMCVRNQPIIHAEDLEKIRNKTDEKHAHEPHE